MHDDAKAALKQAIQRSLPFLRERVEQFSELHLVWSKHSEGRWVGEYQQRPALHQVYASVDKQLREVGVDFANQFFAKHPEYEGLVGFSRYGLIRLGMDKSYILRSALGYLWDQHGTFECNEASVDAVVEEVAAFVDLPNVRFRFQAQLLNYRMTCPSLTFPEGLTIRRLSEQEVSSLHGGSLLMSGGLRPQTSGIHEFVIEGEHEAAKVFGDLPKAFAFLDGVDDLPGFLRMRRRGLYKRVRRFGIGNRLAGKQKRNPENRKKKCEQYLRHVQAINKN